MKRAPRKWLSLLLTVALICTFSVTVTGCNRSKTTQTSKSSSENSETSEATLSSAGSTAGSSVAAGSVSGTASNSIIKSGGGSGAGGTTAGNQGQGGSSGTLATGVTPKSNIDPYANIPSNLKGSTVKVLLWYAPSKDDLNMFANFTKKTGINVKVIQTTYDLYQTKLASLIATGVSPDVACMSCCYFPVYITKRLVQPIAAGNFNLKDPIYDLQQMGLFKWNGTYYGVNLKGSLQCCDMIMMLYNKTMFENNSLETPRQLWNSGNWNWSTFLNAAQKLTGTFNGKTVYGYGCNCPEEWMMSEGTDFVKFSGSKIINNMSDPKVATAWEWVDDLMNKYKVQIPGTQDISLLTSGKVAMYADGEWWMEKSMSVAQQMTDDWDAVPFPSPKGQSYLLATGSKVWCLATGAKNPKGAAYFLRYWLDPNNAPSTIWAHSDMQDMFAAMVKANKYSMFSEGVIGFNTLNDYWSLWGDLENNGSAQVPTYLKKWSPKVDGIINDISNEIPTR